VNVVVISVTKEGVKFSTRGDIGTANIVLRQNTTVDKVCYQCKYRPVLFCMHRNNTIDRIAYMRGYDCYSRKMPLSLR
jgi:hypothetical protein